MPPRLDDIPEALLKAFERQKNKHIGGRPCMISDHWVWTGQDRIMCHPFCGFKMRINFERNFVPEYLEDPLEALSQMVFYADDVRAVLDKRAKAQSRAQTVAEIPDPEATNSGEAPEHKQPTVVTPKIDGQTE